MAKRKETKLIERRDLPLNAVYANDVGIGYQDTEVAINFSVITPSIFEPHDDEFMPVVRVYLSWETAESLSEALNDVINKYKKFLKRRQRTSDKK